MTPASVVDVRVPPAADAPGAPRTRINRLNPEMTTMAFAWRLTRCLSLSLSPLPAAPWQAPVGLDFPVNRFPVTEETVSKVDSGVS